MEYPKTFIQLPDIPEEIESTSQAYDIAFSLVRAGDVVGWRKLVINIRRTVFDSLVQWRKNELENIKVEGIEHSVQILDKAVEIISPLMVIALVGVESGREEFRDQKSLLDDLLNIIGWNTTANNTWKSLPYALGYIYHSLHGCVSLGTNQIDLAMTFAKAKIPDLYDRKKVVQVWQMSDLVGWPQTLGPNCVKSWEYLTDSYKRSEWGWLPNIFGAKSEEYRSLLVAYYMALNIHELAVTISLEMRENSNDGEYRNFGPHFNIPLTFMSEDHEIYQHACHLLQRNPEAVTKLWECVGVKHIEMEEVWKQWLNSCDQWLKNTYRQHPGLRISIYNNMDHHKAFFEIFQS